MAMVGRRTPTPIKEAMMPYVRTRAKGTTFSDDLYEFTNKWTETPADDGRNYNDYSNLEQVDEKPETKKPEAADKEPG
jgi:hypothetical protein